MYNVSDENIKKNEITLLDGLYQMTEAYKNKKTKDTKTVSLVKKVRRKLIDIRNRKMMPNSNFKVNEILPDADYKRPDKNAYFSDKRIAVYTAIFGPYDEIIEPLIKPDNVDYYIITDRELSEDSMWKKLDPNDILPSDITDNIFKNRYVKMLPHTFFKDYEYSVYIDGNVKLTSDATVFTTTLEDFPVAMHRHKQRTCAYDEIDACILKAKDNQERLEKHRELLKEHNLPKDFGLLEATVIARKHNDSTCIALMENWWKEFQMASHRDQISLVDCIWTMGLDIKKMAVLGNNIVLNHHLIIVPHNRK